MPLGDERAKVLGRGISLYLRAEQREQMSEKVVVDFYLLVAIQSFPILSSLVYLGRDDSCSRSEDCKGARRDSRSNWLRKLGPLTDEPRNRSVNHPANQREQSQPEQWKQACSYCCGWGPEGHQSSHLRLRTSELSGACNRCTDRFAKRAHAGRLCLGIVL